MIGTDDGVIMIIPINPPFLLDNINQHLTIA